MVMLEPLISLIVCSCLGGPGLSPLTNHHRLRQGGQGSHGGWEEWGRQEVGGGGGQYEVERERKTGEAPNRGKKKGKAIIVTSFSPYKDIS